MNHLGIILAKMYEIVGADYKGIPTESDWYVQHEWTQETQDVFTEWLIDYLTNDRTAREEIMRTTYKKKCKKAAIEFVCNYGWKLKE